MLNRYANAAINGWDGNSVEINDTDGYILTPQVGAGTKDEQNRFTGMLMGSVKDNANNTTKTGLLGYDAGQQSLFLDAESGGAIFGKDLNGQITIDPQSNKSYLVIIIGKIIMIKVFLLLMKNQIQLEKVY